MEKGWRSINIKKKNVKKIIIKLKKKKKDNNVDADMTQLERSNNRCYALAFRYI